MRRAEKQRKRPSRLRIYSRQRCAVWAMSPPKRRLRLEIVLTTLKRHAAEGSATSRTCLKIPSDGASALSRDTPSDAGRPGPPHRALPQPVRILLSADYKERDPWK